MLKSRCGEIYFEQLTKRVYFYYPNNNILLHYYLYGYFILMTSHLCIRFWRARALWTRYLLNETLCSWDENNKEVIVLKCYYWKKLTFTCYHYVYCSFLVFAPLQVVFYAQFLYNYLKILIQNNCNLWIAE